MKINFYILAICYAISFLTSAQETFTGTLDQWSNGKADVVSGYGAPIKIGEINNDGVFIIHLTDDLIAQIKKDEKEYNSNSTDGWTTKAKTISEVFYCESENAEIINGSLPVEGFSYNGIYVLGIIESQKELGGFRAVSSKAFNDSFFSYGQKDYTKGYFLDYYYVEDSAVVKGVCKSTNYTLDLKETFDIINEYNIDFKKGWNIVKTEVVELYTDQSGKVFPLKTVWKTLDKIPEDVLFVFISLNK